MWGQVKKGEAEIASSRIIPTRVGTSDFIVRRFLSAEDHPHACEDKVIRQAHHDLNLGSSPRVWGQELVLLHSCKHGGIIPTRVGTRINSAEFIGIRYHHPHACGDKKYGKSLCWDCSGSSPRVWGQDLRKHLSVTTVRIIPTRVGTSSTFSAGTNATEDHPHACGDKNAFQEAAKIL